MILFLPSSQLDSSSEMLFATRTRFFEGQSTVPGAYESVGDQARTAERRKRMKICILIMLSV